MQLVCLCDQHDGAIAPLPLRAEMRHMRESALSPGQDVLKGWWIAEPIY